MARNNKHRLGVTVTASHNSWKSSGFKIIFDKRPVWGKELDEIKLLAEDERKIVHQSLGKKAAVNSKPDYLRYLLEEFKDLKGSKKRILIDCMRGASVGIVPYLIKVFDWDFVQCVRNKKPEDGDKLPYDPDPTKISNVKSLLERVQLEDFDFGVAFDGDGDRISIVTKGGLVPGDKLLAVFVNNLTQVVGEKTTIVAEVKCSQALELVAEKKGFRLQRCATGHSVIQEEMSRSRAVLAGEFSGHIFFADRYFGFDDALYAFLRFFQITDNSGSNTDLLFSQLPQFFSAEEDLLFFDSRDVMRTVVSRLAVHFEDKGFLVSRIDGAKVFFDLNSWALIRLSNTGNHFTLRFESDHRATILKMQQELKTANSNF
jgi:phosphomannomutase/phosphoglucomutase